MIVKRVTSLLYKTSGLSLILSSGEGRGFDFIQGFKNTSSHHVGCTKTNRVNVTQVLHVEPM